jgi:hypothetical protein
MLKISRLFLVLLLLLGVAIITAFLSFRSIKKPLALSPIHAFDTGSLMWNDGPRVELSAGRIDILNRETADLIARRAPGQILSCTISSGGVAVVNYQFSSNFPVELEKDISSSLSKRAVELAHEQLHESHH